MPPPCTSLTFLLNLFNCGKPQVTAIARRLAAVQLSPVLEWVARIAPGWPTAAMPRNIGAEWIKDQVGQVVLQSRVIPAAWGLQRISLGSVLARI